MNDGEEAVCAEKGPKQEEETLVLLPANYGIRDVEDVHMKLSEALESGTGIRVDLSEVEAVDTAAIQLLMAFSAEARRTGVPVHWHHPTELFADSSHLLGLETEFQTGLTGQETSP